MPGSLPTPAQTNHLELQVWDRGHSTGQFPAARALRWVLLVFAGMWRLEQSCAGSLCQLELPPSPAEPGQAQWVQHFIPESPDGVSECAPDTGLGCREKLNSPAPAALGLLCSPPTAGAKARSKVQVLRFRALPGR